MDRKFPPEIYMQIFQHLSQKDVGEAVSLVCKKWYQLLSELRLVERSINLDSPVSQSIAKLLKDIRRYPAFASRIKTVNDFFKGRNHYENRSQDYHLYGSFSDCISLCPNLEKLKLCLNDLCYHSKLFRKLPVMECPLTNGLDTLEIYLNNQNKWHITRYFYVYVELHKLAYRTIPGLQQLIFHSSSDIYEDDLKFVFRVSYSINKNCAIRKIKIECPSAKITKHCLDQIDAFQFPTLENLYLFLTLIEYSEDLEPASRSNKVDTEFDNLKNFCLTKLKDYNIFLFNENRSSCLFSIDNCTTTEDAYSYIATKKANTIFATYNARD